MQLTQCLHTAILVSDLDKAEYFYGKVLGLAKVDRSLTYLGAWYQLGDHQIHLIVQPNLKKSVQNQEKWGRNPHIAFAVADLNHAIATLQAQGYPIQMSASGRAAAFIQDPDGNVIEINQT